jgi:hypothetical protein
LSTWPLVGLRSQEGLWLLFFCVTILQPTGYTWLTF